MAITTSVVLYDPTDTSPEVRTFAGFLAGVLRPAPRGVHGRPAPVLPLVRRPPPRARHRCLDEAADHRPPLLSSRQRCGERGRARQSAPGGLRTGEGPFRPVTPIDA